MSRALDECLERLDMGESVESCLMRYPELKPQFEPLLRTAAALYAHPVVAPSEEFKTISKARIKARLYARSSHAGAGHLPGEERVPAGKALLRWLRGPERVAAPIAITIALTAGVVLFLVASLLFLSPPATVKYQCALSILGGEVEVRQADGEVWEEAEDGTWLRPGSGIRTAGDSHALVTFFDGSTISLEPDTELEIRTSESSSGPRISVRQALGRTWSSVPAGDPGKVFEIQTPSASVTVIGTLFEIDVDHSSLTTVRTAAGLVSVSAQDKQVDIGAGQQVRVAYGQAPSEPEDVCEPESYFIFRVGPPALASVCDPAGASTGRMPGGISFAQIRGAYTTLSADGSQVIYLPTPVPGRYSLILRAQGENAFSLQLEAVLNGEVVVFEEREYGLSGESGSLVPIIVLEENGRLAGIQFDDVEPLGDRAPEKFVATGTGGQWLEPGDTGDPILIRTLTAGSDWGGSVKVPGEGTFDYSNGDTVELLAEPEQGYCFLGWVGNVRNPSSPATRMEMTEDQAVTARFARSFMLTVVSSEGGSVKEPGQGVFFYCGGSTVTLVAEPREGWKFDGWTGNTLDRTSSMTGIVMDHSQIVCANFVPE
ncbi:MAG: FecR domain-containing protein [Dehalococcoidia bacterium]|nr:FecR domain-containing protein [Dehalococcoidia bacterium]